MIYGGFPKFSDTSRFVLQQIRSEKQMKTGTKIVATRMQTPQKQREIWNCRNDVSQVIRNEMNKEPPSVEEGNKKVKVTDTHCSPYCQIPTDSSTYYVPFYPLSTPSRLQNAHMHLSSYML